MKTNNYFLTTTNFKNIENGRINGSLFQIEGLIDMFPMVDVSLIKDKK